jgi:NADPH:quinone reductase-like Zn-dependent oxidoreductase
MASYGLLVVEWPLVLGVDASGVIVEAGEDAQSKYSLKVGDYVCGCTRLGSKQYSTGQEYFLMDAAVTIPKPKNITLVQAATLGVGAQTACLALFENLKLELPTSNTKDKGEWVVVLGGASSVGKAAIQLARAAGYKVIASCSNKSKDMVTSLGASSFDYKSPVEDQVKAIHDATGGKIAGVFDAVAADDPVVVKQLFKSLDKGSTKLFTTTNDWSGIKDFEGGQTTAVELGEIGRPNATNLNKALAKHIPIIVSLVEAGSLKPAEYEIIGEGGFEDLLKAYTHQKAGAGGSKKVVVKVQDE